MISEIVMTQGVNALVWGFSTSLPWVRTTSGSVRETKLVKSEKLLKEKVFIILSSLLFVVIFSVNAL